MKLFVLESVADPYWVQLESSHHVVIFYKLTRVKLQMQLSIQKLLCSKQITLIDAELQINHPVDI